MEVDEDESTMYPPFIKRVCDYMFSEFIHL